MALGKKVKTLHLEQVVTLTTGDDGWIDAVDSHTFQDDVRVIGMQTGTRAEVEDAGTNTDGELKVGSEVSRHGVSNRDGALLKSGFGASWNGLFSIPTGMTGSAPLVFPDGHGVDFDDGEVIYLHHFGKLICSEDVIAYTWAIVYYVER